MNKKITKEKSKEFKKSMFNSLNFSLMKKQLFSFIALLAMVLVGGNAMGQAVGTGTMPETDAYWAIVGSRTTHNVTLDGLAGTAVWSVLIVSAEDDNIGEAGVAAADADYNIVSGGGGSDATITIQWLRTLAAGSVYAVQVEEEGDSDDGCTTRRRSYVGVFGFEVDIALADNNTGGGLEVNNPKEKCNTWSGLVVNNTHTAAEIGAPDRDLIVNPTNGTVNKVTETYFRVTITLSGNPGSFDLSTMKWRFTYSLQGTNNISVYQVESHDGAVFGSQAGAVTIGAAATSTVLDLTNAANNVVYVGPASAGATTASYDFTIRNHNLLGTIPTTYSLRVDQADIEFTTADANTDYNNGTKYHSAVGAADQSMFADALTGVQTVNHGPATAIIQIAD